MQPARNIALPGTSGAALDKPVLIYDGECAVCRKAVEWIRARMAPDVFEFLSCYADELAQRFPSIEKAACLQAMHLVLPDGRVLIGERALPEILRRLPRYRWCAPLFSLPGAGFLSRAAYRRIAKHRHRLAQAAFPGNRE